MAARTEGVPSHRWQSTPFGTCCSPLRLIGSSGSGICAWAGCKIRSWDMIDRSTPALGMTRVNTSPAATASWSSTGRSRCRRRRPRRQRSLQKWPRCLQKWRRWKRMGGTKGLREAWSIQLYPEHWIS
ncbi:unnamed protein product [Durusdinium trenchii]|uniref:Uncharacterized protein n=1 Tax=Durusdinium trenchii TaxID=1381693 RepID=A0ABP0R127_9DINO